MFKCAGLFPLAEGKVKGGKQNSDHSDSRTTPADRLHHGAAEAAHLQRWRHGGRQHGWCGHLRSGAPGSLRWSPRTLRGRRRDCPVPGENHYPPWRSGAGGVHGRHWCATRLRLLQSGRNVPDRERGNQLLWPPLGDNTPRWIWSRSEGAQ